MIRHRLKVALTDDEVGDRVATRAQRLLTRQRHIHHYAEAGVSLIHEYHPWGPPFPYPRKSWLL